MKYIKYFLVGVLLIFSVLIYVLRPKKDYFIFPECLSELEKCPPEKKARLIAFFNNYMEGDFQEKQLVQWMAYYDKYKQDVDFCFIMSHNDTSYFNDFIHKIGFTAPFVYDVNDCFVEKYNYLFISYLTDNQNRIIDITNPSLGDGFENSIQKAIK